jgi:FkbM family methyltransferase
MNKYNYFNDKKFPIVVSNETRKITPHTFLDDNTMWETESIQYFFNEIPRDKPLNIIDVGAQSGLYSLFAKYLPMSTFYSFEPFKQTFDLLNDNIALNNITNVETYNIGLSNKKERVILNTSISHNGLHTIGNTPLRFNDICKIEIDVDTIDNLFYEKNIPINFIKIDTEGWEFFILKGAEKIIKKYKPFIQIEWNEINMRQCGVDKNELSNYIDELNYIATHQISEELFLVPKDENYTD